MLFLYALSITVFSLLPISPASIHDFLLDRRLPRVTCSPMFDRLYEGISVPYRSARSNVQ